MKIYAKTIRVSLIIAIISLGVSIMLSSFDKDSLEIYQDICVGIFSSSFLVLLSSVIGYRVERKRTLEYFCKYTKRIVNKLSKYDVNWELSQKIDFFINFDGINIDDWDMMYDNIYFLLDFKKKNHNYIYNEIYNPIVGLLNVIHSECFHFREYQKAIVSGKIGNCKVNSEFVKEIEKEFIEYRKHKIEATECESDYNKFVHSLYEELNNEYYRIMYRKKHYNQELERENNIKEVEKVE